MSSNDLSKRRQIEVAVSALNQALDHLNQHDYVAAQVMVSVVGQVLEDLQVDFDRHFEVEEALKQILNPFFYKFIV